jgi:hypothetical protein
MVVNSSRMKDTGDGGNMALLEVMNGLNIFLFPVFNYVYMVIRGNLVYNASAPISFRRLPECSPWGRSSPWPRSTAGNSATRPATSTRAVAGNISFRKYGLVFQKRCR